MIINFEFFLTAVALVSGGIAGLHFLLSRFCQPSGKCFLWFKRHPAVAEYAYSFFPILLLVLLLRSFVAEPFRIPTGSLEPTLMVGDFIVVNKYHYGLRLPVLGTKFFAVAEPKRGDIAVFHYPLQPGMNFVKRVIGLPGDHISYTDKTLYINNQPMRQKELIPELEAGSSGYAKRLKEENLFGVKHQIFLRDDLPPDDFDDIVIPPEHYFVMGDNRDESNDSRGWGFVPEKNLIGQAKWIWLSLDLDHWRVRFKRLGQKII